jgi:hypothetical protein
MIALLSPFSNRKSRDKIEAMRRSPRDPLLVESSHGLEELLRRARARAQRLHLPPAPESGDKLTRFGPFSSQWGSGLLRCDLPR